MQDAAEDSKAGAEGAKYLLPDRDILTMFKAIACQLGVMRGSGLPHRALVAMGREAGGSNNKLQQVAKQMSQKASCCCESD